MTGIPYAISALTPQAHGGDLEMVSGEGRDLVSGFTTRLDADVVADMRARLKRGVVQRRYFMENSGVQ
jgi:hypothetical protein